MDKTISKNSKEDSPETDKRSNRRTYKMKKWLVALMVLVVSAVLCFGMAAAEGNTPEITLRFVNNVTDEIVGDVREISDGYYYKFYVELPEGANRIQTGFGKVDAEVPDENEIWDAPINQLRHDNGGYYMISLPNGEPNGENTTSDAFFYRIGGDDPWQKLIFRYGDKRNSTAVDNIRADGDPNTPASENAAPTYPVYSDFGVEWDAVDGADGYLVGWHRQGTGDDQWVFRFADNAGYDMRDERDLFVGEAGIYELQVLPLVNGTVRSNPAQPDATFEFVDYQLKLDIYQEGLNDGQIPMFCSANLAVSAQRYERRRDGGEWHVVDGLPQIYFERTYTNENNQEVTDGWQRGVLLNEWGYGETEWVADVEQQVRIFAEIQIDGEAVRTQTFTLTPQVPEKWGDNTAIPAGAYDEPVTLRQDEWLDVWIDNNAIQARYYGIEFRPTEEGGYVPDCDWICVGEESGETGIRVPLTRLEVGRTYDAYIFAMKPGYEMLWGEPVATVTVAQPYTDKDLVISCLKEEYRVGEPLGLSASFSINEALAGFNGRMNVRIYRKGNPEEEYYNYDEPWFVDYNDNYSGGLFHDPRFSLFDAGEFTMQVDVWQFVEDEDDNLLVSDSRDFTVYAENGDLQEELSNYDPKLPKYVPVQDDYVLEFTTPSAPAEWYCVRVTDAENDRCYAELRDVPVGETQELRFNTWDGLVLNAEITAYADGYSCYHYMETGIPALTVPEIGDGESPISIMLSKEPTDIHEVIDISVSAPGAEWVALWDSNCGQYGFWKEDNRDFGVFEGRSVGENTIYRVCAVAEFCDENGERTILATEPMVFKLNCVDEQVGKFTIDYADGTEDVTTNSEDGNKELTVTRGTNVTVTLSEPIAGSVAPENYWFQTHRDNSDDQNYEWNWNWTDQNTRTATILTAGMPSGDYWIGGCGSKPGYYSYETEWDNQVVYLHIVEPDEDEPTVHLQVENGEVTTGEEILFSIYAKGANSINLYRHWPDQGWNDRWDGDSTVDNRHYDDAGTYQLVAEAWFPCYDENDEPIYVTDDNGNIQYDDYGNPMHEHFRVMSEPVEVTVTASEGKLEQAEPTGTIPGSLIWNGIRLSENADQNEIELTANKPAGADYMKASINVMNPDGDYWDEPIKEFDTNGNSIDISISHNELYDWGIQPGQTLIVEVNSTGRGYESSMWRRSIPVIEKAETGENDPQATLSVVDQNGDVVEPVNVSYSALINDDISLKIHFDQIEETDHGLSVREVRVFDGEGFNYDAWNDWKDNEFFWGAQLRDPGDYTLYALYTYDEWNGRGEDHRKWYSTNPVTVRATATGTQVGEFTITIDNSTKTVTRGENVKVSITESTGATNYWINDEFEADWFWVNETERKAEIETINLEPGTYYIGGGANAPGWLNRDTGWVSFTVNERTDTQNAQNGIYFEIKNFAIDNQGEFILDTNSNKTVQLGQALDISIYAPGASYIGFILDDNQWHFDENGNYCWGEGPVESWSNRNDVVWKSKGDCGTHKMKAVAIFPDEQNWRETAEVTVTVTANDGELSFNTSGVPSYLSVDEDALFSIPMPANADYMAVEIKEVWQETPRQNDNGWRNRFIDGVEVRYNKNGNNAAVISIAEEKLHSERTIELNLFASGVGFEDAGQEIHIPVIKEASSPKATISLRGRDANDNFITLDDTSILKDEDAEIWVVPNNGDEEIAELRFFDGKGFWENGRSITPDTHGHWFDWDNAHTKVLDFAISNRYEDSGTYAVYALVKMNGDTEWSSTNVLELSVGANGEIGSFALANGYEREQYAERGTYHSVFVTIPNNTAYTGYTGTNPTVDDYYFWADVYRVIDPENDEYLEWAETVYSGLDDQGRPEIKVQTGNLGSGQYILHARCVAGGWEIGDCTEDVILNVYDPEEMVLEVASTEIPTCTAINASFYAPNAERICIQMDDDVREDGDNGWEGDSWTSDENWMFERSGRHTITGWAKYKDDDNWYHTEPRYIQVYSNGQVEEFNTDDIRGYYVEGYGYGFYLPRPENADYMNVQVEIRRANGTVTGITDAHGIQEEGFGWGFNSPEEFTRYFKKDALQAGDALNIMFQAYKDGLDASMGGVEVPVIADADRDNKNDPYIHIEVEGLVEEERTDNEETYTYHYGTTGKEYVATVTVNESALNEIMGIRFFDGFNGFVRDGQNDVFTLTNGSREFEIGFPETGHYVLYAEAVYSNGSKKTSEAFDLPIVADEYAAVPDNAFDVPNSIAAGDIPKFNVPAKVEDDGWYNVFMNHEYGSDVFQLFGLVEDQDISLCYHGEDDDPTNDVALEPGTYVIEFRYHGVGKKTSVVRRTIEVLERSVMLTTASGRRIFHYGDEVELVAEAPGANAIEWSAKRGETTFTVNTPNDRLPWFLANVITTVGEGENETGITVTATPVYNGESDAEEAAVMTIFVRSLGEPPEPWVNYPEMIYDNQGMEIEVGGVEKDVWFTVELENNETNAKPLNITSPLPTGQKITVESGDLPAGDYTLTLKFGYDEDDENRQGYDIGQRTYHIIVTHEHQPVFYWDNSEGYVTCTFQKWCPHCGKEQFVVPIEIDVEMVDEWDSTCEEAGGARYKASIQLNDEEYYEDEQSYEIGVANDHDYNDWTFEWNDEDPNHVTAELCHYCRNCGKREAVEAEVTKVDDLSFPATCTEHGEDRYTASVTLNGENEARMDVWTVYFEPIGHKWSEWDTEREASCEQTGLMTATCSNDPEHHVRSKNIPKTEHKWSTTYEWDDEGNVTATRICSPDNAQNPTHREEETVGSYRAAGESPTETTAGTIVLRSEPFANPFFEQQEMETDESIPALNSLNVLRLPSALSEVEEEAFMGSNCQAVIIPASCRRIRQNAFANCSNLLYVKFESVETQVSGTAFSGCQNVILDTP